MDLNALTQMLLRRAWLVLAGAGLGISVGLVLALSRPDGWEGVTRLALEMAMPADYGQTQATKDLMRSVVEDIKTHEMADIVAAGLEERFGAEWMATHNAEADNLHGMLYAGKLRAGADPSVFEIKLGARHPDAQTAVRISETWAQIFSQRREDENRRERDRNERVEIKIRDETIPEKYAPRKKLIVGVAGLLGAALGAGLMLLLEYLSLGVIRKSEDLEGSEGLPLLATLPGATLHGSGGGAGIDRRRLVRSLKAGAIALWPAFLLAVLGLLSAYGFSQLQTPTFRARTRIALEPANVSNWGNAMAIRETMHGYKADIKTRRMAREVNTALALDRPIDVLLDDRRINVAEDMDLFEIIVDIFDPEPELAAAISQKWAETFIEEHRVADLNRDHRDRILVRLRDRTDTVPWRPKTGLNLLAGAVLGALIGLGLQYLKALLKKGLIMSEEDARMATELPLLGVVPSASEGREI